MIHSSDKKLSRKKRKKDSKNSSSIYLSCSCSLSNFKLQNAKSPLFLISIPWKAKSQEMLNRIPELVKKLWNDWNIRGVILFSLSLQTVLVFFAPLWKTTGHELIILIIWSAYLLADWTANFGIGLITERARDTPELSMPMEKELLCAECEIKRTK